jgi:HSP20 family protein
MDEKEEKPLTPQKNQSNKTGWLIALVIVLLAVLGFQSWRLYRIEERIDRVAIATPQASLDDQTAPRILPMNPPNRLAPRAPGQTATPPQSPFPDPFGFQPLSDPNNWDPFEEMNRMQQQMDRMFNEAFNRFQISPQFHGLAADPVFSPHLDIQDTGKDYLIKIDLPGMDRTKIEAKVENRDLIITGESNESSEERQQNGTIITQERRVGRFERTVPLPGPVKSKELELSYQDGVLTVRLPKA